MGKLLINVSIESALTVLLIGSGCSIPLDGLYDRFLSPKWHMALCPLSVLLAYCGWKSFHKRACPISVTESVSQSAHMVLWCCLIYVFVHDIPQLADYGLFVIPIQGMYDNASGLSLNLCLLLAMAMMGYDRMGKVYRVLLLAAFALTLMVVVLSMSRTGMICMAFLAIFCLTKTSCIPKLMKLATTIVLLACAVTATVITKGGSTSGRRFILERTIEIVYRSPVTGFGPYGFEREYMTCQGNYLASHPNSPAGWYADEIIHPLNEFLYLWVDFGIVAPLALAILLLFPFFWYAKTRNSNLCMSLLPLSVVILFSLFSYPSKYPLSYVALALPYSLLLKQPIRRLWRHHPKVIASVLLLSGIAVMSAALTEFYFERRWSRLIRISEVGGSRVAVDGFDKLYDHYHDNPYFLYSDMVVQYKAGRCGKAMELYGELAGYQSGYNMELLAGDAQTHLGEYDAALGHYKKAHDMCPVRFAPLYGMLDVYRLACDSVRADSVAHVILGKKVKVPSSAVASIKQEAHTWMKRR